MAYVHGYSEREMQRLCEQAEILEDNGYPGQPSLPDHPANALPVKLPADRHLSGPQELRFIPFCWCRSGLRRVLPRRMCST